jgi:Cof subfamily protein (haloacid dehalogenase superfamily)
MPTFETISERLIPQQVAKRALASFQSHGVQTWLFVGRDWLLRDRAAPLVSLEERTVGFRPKQVSDLTDFVGAAAKIVGVSQDYELLARCERELSGDLADSASVVRSQPYYLDITHPLANKGAALLELARLLAVSPSEIAVIGDGRNDIMMFAASGLSIAMGNASVEVKSKATFVTASNEDEGFAKGIKQFVLPYAAARPSA